MKTLVFAVVVAFATFAAHTAFAQGSAADATDMQALRAAVKADKKGLVAATMNLTPAEAKKFWPIYDAYQADLELANRRLAVAVEGLVARDKPMTDPYAKLLMNELIVADELELKGRKSMRDKVMRALPPSKAARYLQLESKIRAVQAYDIAATIPLVK